jgi:hypothetical protein
VPPDDALGSATPQRVVWSERLKSQARLAAAADLDPIKGGIRAAWDES